MCFASQSSPGKQSSCSEILLRFLECWRSFLSLSCCSLLGYVTVGSTQKIAIRAWWQVSTGPQAAKYPESPANWIRRAFLFKPSEASLDLFFIHQLLFKTSYSFCLHPSLHFSLFISVFLLFLALLVAKRPSVLTATGFPSHQVVGTVGWEIKGEDHRNGVCVGGLRGESVRGHLTDSGLVFCSSLDPTAKAFDGWLQCCLLCCVLVVMVTAFCLRKQNTGFQVVPRYLKELVVFFVKGPLSGLWSDAHTENGVHWVQRAD